MKLKTLLPLIIILVLLAAIALLRDSGSKTPTIIEQTRLETLAPEELKARDMARIELFAGAKPDEKVILERDGDRWRVASHFNAPVAADAIETYLDNMLGLKGEFRATADTDDQLAPYSLTQDEAFHVQAFTAEATEPGIDILFGKAPDFRSVFMRKAGDNRVFIEAVNLRKEAGLFGDDLAQAPTADKWLDKDIVKIDKEQVAKIALTTPDTHIAFEKQAKEVPPPDPPAEEDAVELTPPPAPIIEHEWILTAGGPGGDAFKQIGLDSLLQKLVAFTATTVVDPGKLEDWGLDAPAFKAVISTEGQEDIILEGGRPDPSGSGYLRLAGAKEEVVYEVSKYNFEGLFPKGSDLFDLPKLALNDISRVEIRQPEGRVVLEKDGAEWDIVEPVVDLNPQKTAITTLTSSLGNWQPAGFADPDANTGKFDKVLTISAGDGTHTLALGGDAASIDGVYARIDGNATTLIVNRTDVTKFLLKPRDLFELRAMDFHENDITGIDVSHEDASFSLAKEDGAWALRLGEDLFDADEAAVGELLSILSGLQADGFRAEPLETWQPRTSIALKADTREIATLSMMPDNDDRYLMRIGDKATDLEMSREDADDLIQLLAALKTPKIEVPVEEADTTEVLEGIPETPLVLLPESEEAPAPESAAPAIEITLPDPETE
jgi:hypothetical protein